MSLVRTIDAMVAAGCTPEQIAAVVRAHEEAENQRGTRSIPHTLRTSVLKRDNFTCSYCGATNVELCADHVIPYSRGGRTSEENLVAACRPCNASKKDRLLSEWGGRK